jgi:hypothetical protein
MAPVPGPTKVGFDQNCQSNLNIQSPTRPRVVHIKTDAQVAYAIQLGRFWTHWKDKEIKFPIELVPCRNSSEINGSHRNNWTSEICLGAAPQFLVVGPCIVSRPIRVASRGYLNIPRLFIISILHTIRV